MSDLQKEACIAGRRAKLYSSIKSVFDQLDGRFATVDLLSAANIKSNTYNNMHVKNILERDFKCDLVGASAGKKVWRKPNIHTEEKSQVTAAPVIAIKTAISKPIMVSLHQVSGIANLGLGRYAG